MKVSAQGRYAVRSIINLSRSHSGVKAVREVAEEEDISSLFLEKIFSRLKKAELITSVRGAHGGFRLNRDIKDITVMDILAAINEEMNPTPCSSDKCGKECDISYFWSMTKQHMMDFFSNITIYDIIHRKITI